jgi:hypothetical protein
VLLFCLVGCSKARPSEPSGDEPSISTNAEERLLVLDGRRYSYTGSSTELTAAEDQITIRAGGTYRIQGTLTEGALRVSAPPDATVYLILDSVSITSSYHPPLLLEEAACVILISEEGSVNRLTDGRRALSENSESRGCLVSRCGLILRGNGTLCINGKQEVALLCEDDLHLSETTLSLCAPEAGVCVRDRLRMESGALTVSAAKQGTIADGGSTAVGKLEFLGGRLTISCTDTALVASSSLFVGEAQVSIHAPSRYRSPRTVWFDAEA